MTLTVKDVVSRILDWASAESTRIEKVHNVNGGWEKWAQIEITVFINHLKAGVNVTREVESYTNHHMKADLSMLSTKAEGQPGVQVRPNVLVELKCHNPYLDLPTDTKPNGLFLEALQADREKFAFLQEKNKKDGFVVVGVVYSTAAKQAILEELEKLQLTGWNADAAPGAPEIWALWSAVQNPKT